LPNGSRTRSLSNLRTLAYYRVCPSGLSFNALQMQRCTEQVLQSAYQRSPQKVGPILPTAYAYLYRYLARVALTGGQVSESRQFIGRALKQDMTIVLRDSRSLATLGAVLFAPLSQILLHQSLDIVKR
jgi:hypothetical protein